MHLIRVFAGGGSKDCFEATSCSTLSASGSQVSVQFQSGFDTLGGISFVLNFTDSFLELGIGSEQVASGKEEIKRFDNDLYHYISHVHIAVSGFIAATGLAVAACPGSASAAGTCGLGRRCRFTVLGLTVALPAHYPWGFATIGHLGLIYLATVGVRRGRAPGAYGHA
jgi:hypothetical protein